MLSPYFWILRPLNSFMAAFATLIGYSISLGYFAFDLTVAIAMVVAFLVCGAGQAINDYFDRNIDAKINPDRMIPSGKMKAETALHYSIILFLIGNLLAAYFLKLESFTISMLFSMLLMVYPAFLTKYKYLGNWIVAAGTGITLIFGASLAGNYSVVLFLAFAALMVNESRELIKDWEDVKADAKAKTTLPMILSEKTVTRLIFLFYLIGIAVVYAPYLLLGFGNLLFLLLVSVANIVFLYSFKLVLAKKYHEAEKTAKTGMLIALIGFLLGV